MSERNRVVKVFTKPSKTKQSFKEECDIKNILRRYHSTGSWSSTFGQSLRRPLSGDFTNVPDYQDALNTVITAQTSFMALPSVLRDRFSNDPAKLLAFLSDKSNLEEAIELGLVDRVLTSTPQGGEATATGSGDSKTPTTTGSGNVTGA